MGVVHMIYGSGLYFMVVVHIFMAWVCMDVAHVLWFGSYVYVCMWCIWDGGGLYFYGFGPYAYVCGSCFIVVVHMLMDVAYIYGCGLSGYGVGSSFVLYMWCIVYRVRSYDYGCGSYFVVLLRLCLMDSVYMFMDVVHLVWWWGNCLWFIWLWLWLLFYGCVLALYGFG